MIPTALQFLSYTGIKPLISSYLYQIQVLRLEEKRVTNKSKRTNKTSAEDTSKSMKRIMNTHFTAHDFADLLEYIPILIKHLPSCNLSVHSVIT